MIFFPFPVYSCTHSNQIPLDGKVTRYMRSENRDCLEAYVLPTVAYKCTMCGHIGEIDYGEPVRHEVGDVNGTELARYKAIINLKLLKG